MGFASFGEKSRKDNFYRDIRLVKAALKQAGFDLKFSRSLGKPGYYFVGEASLHPNVKKEIAGALNEIDQEQIEIYKRIPLAQKFYQACSIINLAKKVSLEGGSRKLTKHTRDIGSIIKTKGEKLDYEYIQKWVIKTTNFYLARNPT